MQISDLKALNLPVKNGYTSICNLQSAIINHTCSSTPKRFAPVQAKAIELLPDSKNQVFNVE
jgi:hypothetical protein